MKTGVTTREKQVAGLIAFGYTDKEVAKNLNITAETVRTHRKRTYEKTGSRNTADITRWWFSQKLHINLDAINHDIALLIASVVVMWASVIFLKPTKITASLTNTVKTEANANGFTVVNNTVLWTYTTATTKTMAQIVANFSKVGYLITDPNNQTQVHGGFDNTYISIAANEVLFDNWKNKQLTGYISISLTNGILKAEAYNIIITQTWPVTKPNCTLERLAIENNQLTARFKANESRLINNTLSELINNIK